ncbi:PKD domain-containing protein [Halobacteria archaeon AArc-curdl1]|uniref:PKD domain-containing protein n=1 Tax=Natronosalvus hydrolyticus TaxID=2979988 RepID=A0AAP2Z7D1_9EURY|nr:PKD domain-containing protein [Halobacteria archaeon AArc-curdl1]
MSNNFHDASRSDGARAAHFSPATVLIVVIGLLFVLGAGTILVGASTVGGPVDGPSGTSFLAVQPEPVCAVSSSSVAVGESVTIDASESENVARASFDFTGDGSFDVEGTTNLVQTTSYDEPGEYQPWVQVWSEDGETNEDRCGMITVEAAADPTASFIVEPETADVGETVGFDASASSGDIVEYRWDFGDGATDSTIESPETSHTYSESGTYTVELTVVDSERRLDTTTGTVTVEDSTPSEPVAVCSVSSTTVEPGQSVTIDASDSENAVAANFDYAGNGNWDEQWTGDFVQTTSYGVPGTYTPVVRVWDDMERHDEVTCATITVTDPNEPTAAFTFEPESPFVDDTITFDASDSESPNGDILSYRWDLTGDGTFDVVTSEPVITHTYESSGFYSVSLRIVDEIERTDDTTQTVLVEEPPPVPACSVSSTALEPGETVTIDASDSENAEYASFDFNGDGTNEIDRVETFVVETSYDEPGEYTPVVTAWRHFEYGESVECATITVADAEPPTASFTIDPETAQTGEEVTFDASASSSPTGEILEYWWDFTGDGTVDRTTSDPVTTYTYETEGIKSVSLTVMDARELTGTDEGSVAVRTTEDPDPEPDPEPVAVCAVSSTSAEPGQPVTIDATDSENADAVSFDFEGDGEWDEQWTDEFVQTTSYAEPGTYTPVVRVWNFQERGDTVECATIVVTEPESEAERADPIADLSADPRTPELGQTVTFDASDSSAPDGDLVAYRWDLSGDGTFEETTDEPTVTRAFDEPGSYTITVEVEDDAGATATATTTVRILDPAPVAVCRVSSTELEPGDELTIDLRDSENAIAVNVDFDGNGEWDERWTDEFVLTTRFDEPGEYTPTVLVWDDIERSDEADCATVIVSEPASSGSFIDVPGGGFDIGIEHVGAGVLLAAALAGLAYAAGPFGGGGSSSGGSDNRRTPPPKPPSTGVAERPARYETGTTTVPGRGGTVSVTGIGFRPDLLVLTATNAEGEGDVTATRTAGWTHGVAVSGEEGIEQHAMTVGDDARSVERGTCGVRTGDAVDIVVHGDHSLGRLRAGVSSFTDDGFELRVRATGTDVDHPDVRVLYQAFDTGDDLEVDAGEVPTPTEPGHQHVPLDVDATVVTLASSTAVSGTGGNETWTTDRSIGVSMGAAVSTGPTDVVADGAHLDQAVWNATVSPGRANHASAMCDTNGALALCYQDGDRIAGRTTATVTGLGSALELRYDRTYSGPQKIDPTGSHPISYLAIDAGELTPAVGAVRAPAPGETLEIDCGFEPGLLEVTTSQSAALGHARQTGDVPFGWSTGTAIVRDGHLSQYALSGVSSVPESGAEVDFNDIETPLESVERTTEAATGRLVGVKPKTTLGESTSLEFHDQDSLERVNQPKAGLKRAASAEKQLDGGMKQTDRGREGAERRTHRVESESKSAVEIPSKSTDQSSKAIDSAPKAGVSAHRASLAESTTTDDGDSSAIGDSVAGGTRGEVGLPEAQVDSDSAAKQTRQARDGEKPNETAGDGHIASTLALDADGLIVGRDTIRVTDITERGVSVTVDAERIADHQDGHTSRPYLWYRAWPALEGGERTHG